MAVGSTFSHIYFAGRAFFGASCQAVCSTDINNLSFATVLWRNSCRGAWGTATWLVQQEGNCHVKLPWLFIHFFAASLCRGVLSTVLFVFTSQCSYCLRRWCWNSEPQEQWVGGRKLWVWKSFGVSALEFQFSWNLPTWISPGILRLVKQGHLFSRASLKILSVHTANSAPYKPSWICTSLLEVLNLSCAKWMALSNWDLISSFLRKCWYECFLCSFRCAFPHSSSIWTQILQYGQDICALYWGTDSMFGP